MKESFIHLFIYEVKGYIHDYYSKYSFHPLVLKNSKNTSNNSAIIPIELNNKKINNKKIFTRDIIKNSKNSINNFYTLTKINKNKKNFLSLFIFNYSNKNLSYNFNIFYELYKKSFSRVKISNFFNSISNESILIKIKNNIYSKIKKLLEYNTIIFKNYLDINLNNKSDIKKLYNNSDIIYNIKSNKNIIVIGDIHGSFHSFFRIILRFYIQGIINNDYKLNENYQIIFLGDVIDRGNYSIEVLYIILRLMKKNNINNNLNIILIRGNHESEKIYKYYGFKKEINLKIPKIDNIFINFFKYCPSAIILKYNNTKYWLCHGGFQISKDYINYDNKIIINNYINNFGKIDSQIRWNDFSGKNYTSLSTRSSCSKNFFYNIGNNHLFYFLKKLEIDFIIRGHNDNYSNAMFLKKDNNDKNNNNIIINETKCYNIDINRFFLLNDIKNKDIINNLNYLNNIIKYKKTYKKSKKCLNEILTIYPKNFNKKSFKINNKIKLLPVLTISNNCDIERTQYSDSYIIISDKEYL